MSDSIKNKILQTEFYKTMLEVLQQIKSKYENIELVIQELKKDINRLHSKVDNIEEFESELEQLKLKMEQGFETTRKDIAKKIDGLSKTNKEILESIAGKKEPPTVEIPKKIEVPTEK
jgi:hypothetical protein